MSCKPCTEKCPQTEVCQFKWSDYQRVWVLLPVEILVAWINFPITLNDRFSSASEVSESIIYGSTLLTYMLIVRVSRNASPSSILAADQNCFSLLYWRDLSIMAGAAVWTTITLKYQFSSDDVGNTRKLIVKQSFRNLVQLHPRKACLGWNASSFVKVHFDVLKVLESNIVVRNADK